MFTIMLADDEPEVLQSMLSIIDWPKYGFDFPIGCANGQEAIDRIVENGYAPDVVIADINMPLVNGLALAEYLHERHSKTRVIILSGYDEFAYAQKAIKLQVSDYILKPITPMRLEQILEKTQGELEEERWSEALRTADIVKSDFLSRLFGESLDPSVVEKHAQRFQLPVDGHAFIAIALDVDCLQPLSRMDGDEEWQRYALSNIAQELTQECRGVDVFPGRNGHTLALVFAENQKKALALAEEKATAIGKTMLSTMNCSVSTGIGPAVSTLRDVCKSYEQAERALEHRFYAGANSIIRAETLVAPSEEKMNISEYEKRVAAAARQLDGKQTFDVLDELFAEIRHCSLPVARCVKYCQRLVLVVLQFAAEILDPSQLSILEETWEKHDLYSAFSLQQMQLLTKQFCEQVFEVLSLVYNDAGSAQVLRAEAFIKENYANTKLSLQMLTDHLAVSTSHFSPLFKSKTGQTFVEYLTKLRMEKAKQILALTDKRSYEVAEDVGFSDPHYFSVVFKRMVGASPKEYRETHRKHSDREA